MGKDAQFKKKRRWLRYEVYGNAHMAAFRVLMRDTGKSRHRLAMSAVIVERRNRPVYYYGKDNAQVQRQSEIS
jgi:hypothetical protein